MGKRLVRRWVWIGGGLSRIMKPLPPVVGKEETINQSIDCWLFVRRDDGEIFVEIEAVVR